MNLIDLIISRRSIRKFKSDPISENILTEIIKTAMFAPSARNTQCWEFLIIDDRKLLDELAVIHPYAKMLKYAPVAVLVCGNKQLEDNESYIAQNCSAATQNLMLAAHAHSIGSVWLGVFPRTDRMEPIKQFLKVPEHIIPISLVGLGYSDEVKVLPERFFKEKIHRNTSW